MSRRFALVGLCFAAGAMACDSLDGLSGGFGGEDPGSQPVQTDGGEGGSAEAAASDAGHDAQGIDSATSGVCAAPTTVSFSQTWTPPAPHRTACTQTQIDQYLQFCVGPSADQTACSSFKSGAGAAACVACIYTPDTGTTFGPLIGHASNGTVELNQSGCVALVTGDTSSSSCGAKLQASIECEYAACSGCGMVSSQTALNAFGACRQSAMTGACQSYEQAGSSCANAALSSNPALSSCNAPSFAQAYASIVPLFCL